MGEENGIFFMDEFFVERLASLSENNSGETGEEGSGDLVDQPLEEGETTDGNEQEPGNDKEDQGKEDKEDESGSDPAEPEHTTGDGEQQPDIEEIMERLDLLWNQEDSEEATGVTERLDALIQLLTPEETEDGIETYAVAFPFEGYEDWEYQIGVQYAVYPWGAGYWMEATETFYDPESFVARYDEIISLCANGGTLKDFYVMYIWEDYGGDDGDRLVYDYQAVVEPEPEPGEEEPDETAAQLLSHLETISTTLAEMQQADLEYYQTVYDYQEEMLEMQTAETVCSIVLCVGLFAIFAAMIWEELLWRFK